MKNTGKNIGLFSALVMATALLCGPDTFAGTVSNKVSESKSEAVYTAQCCHGNKQAEEKSSCETKEKKKKEKKNN